MNKSCVWHLDKVLLLICTVLFSIMVYNQYLRLNEERTGTSLSLDVMDEIPFPAITICCQFYDLGQAWDDLKFPVSIFGKKPEGMKQNPFQFYKELERYGLPVMPNLWKYYLTLDKMVAMDRLGATCQVGSKRCGAYKDTSPLTVEKAKDYEEVITQVDAGTWNSRFVADSQLGAVHMCHTLTPSVNADFSSLEGRSIGISWNKHLEYRNVSFFQVYVHDRDEHFLPETYAIETMTSVFMEGPMFQKKLMIKPTLMRKPLTSRRHPCLMGNYSVNLCQINHGWDHKLKLVEDFYGERFQCEIPGIIRGSGKKRPVCDNFDDFNNGTLGHLTLTKRESNNK